MKPSPSSLPSLARIRQPERRRPLQLVLGIVLYAICQLAVTVGAVLTFAVTSGQGSATVGEILAGSGPAAPVGFGVGAACAILGFVLIIRVVSKRRVTEFSRPGALKETLWGLAIGVGIVAAAVGVLGLLGVYQVHGVQLVPGVVTALMFGVGPAVVEEVFFRGILLRLFDSWFGSWPALAIVSVVFALVHSFSSPAGPVAAVYIFFTASLVLNMAYFVTRRLWLPIALHLAFNAAQTALFGFSVSGTAAGDSLVTGSLSGSPLLTGGDMGGEGSLVVVGFALIVGIVMTVIAVRRGAMLPREPRPVDQPR